MKNFITLVLLLVGMTTTIFAQDFIVLKTGSEIKSKVVELTPNEVKYKAFDNLDGPTITIERATVFMCRYANGKTEIITPIETKTIEHQVAKKNETPIVVKNEQQAPPSVLQAPQEPTVIETEQNTGFTGSVFGGGSLPISNYTSKDFENNEKAAGAKLGFNGGIQVGYRLNKTYSFLCEAQFTRNRYEMQVEDVRNIYTLQGDWTHITVMPSFKSEMSIANNINLYSIASAGVSFTSIKGDFADVLNVLDIKPQAKSFVYGFTVGLVFDKTINLGIKTLDFKPAFGDFKPGVSIIQVVAGYQF
jgi:hypothetical protein